MSQTTVALTMAAAYAGMTADSTPAMVRDIAVQAEVSAEIPFGVMLAKGTGDQDGIMPAAANAKLIGVLQHVHSYDPYTELGTVGVKKGVVLNVMRRGRIWVKTETAVAKYDRTHVRYASGSGGTQLGAFRNAAVTNETIDATKSCQFMSSASAGGLAILEVDMLNA